MADMNKVTVKIYGQQYTISGTSSNEDMERVAGYVDELMYKLAKNLPSLSTLSLAVLTAVNMASEYFEVVKINQSQTEQIEKMREDAERYSALWEDAKTSLLKYQEETKNGVEQLHELQRIFNMKNTELDNMKETLAAMTVKYEETERLLQEAQEQLSELAEHPSEEIVDTVAADTPEEENAVLKKKIADLEKQLKKVQRSEKSESRSLADFKEKYKELENSFFDIQMENISLKNELDELKKKQ